MPAMYVETSVVSYLVARPSNDVRVAAAQVATIDWWESRRPAFDVYASELVNAEASRGDPAAANRRLESIADLPMLDLNEQARELARALLREGAVPALAKSMPTTSRLPLSMAWTAS
jgi:hypothetical protein